MFMEFTHVKMIHLKYIVHRAWQVLNNEEILIVINTLAKNAEFNWQ